MLEDRLYRIEERSERNGTHLFRIELNPKDPIFEGHFPDQPVLPAVCMLQIGKELLEGILDDKTDLLEARTMKIPDLVDPTEDQQLEVEMEQEEDDGSVRTSYRISKEGRSVFKFKGRFQRTST